jgi:peptide/nickel transport system substrate-binding protein
MRRLAATSAALAVLVGAGCGGSGNGSARVSAGLPPAGGGGTLTYAVPALPSTLDPLAAQTRPELTVTRQVYEPLIERLTGPYVQAAPQAGLALEARPSRDRTTWTVTLRPNVRFQDGTPFNAAAVLANSRRWQTNPAGQALLPHLFAVDAPRPDEVRFLLDRPVPDLVDRLSSPRLGIVSPRALDPQTGQNAHFLADAPGSGTGAFEPGASGPGRQTLSRFAGWWGSPMGLGPALDGVTFVLAPQPSQRLRLLQDGAAQVADPLGPSGLHAAGSDPLLDTLGGPLRGIGLEGSVRGIDSARAIPGLSSVWLTRLTG